MPAAVRDQRRALALFGWLAVLVTPVTSVGAPAKAPIPKAPEQVLAAPLVTLKVTPGVNGGPWQLRIENTGEGPVRIPADPSLLILDLTPAGSAEPAAGTKKPAAGVAHCVLPDDARSSTDEGRELVIPPRRSWSTTFDPLFYCFGARERAALVAGTSVTARFGWPSRTGAPTPKTLAAPFAVAPVGASVGKVAPLKALDAAPFTLSESVSAGTGPTEDATSSNSVTLSVPDTLDAGRGAELATTVTLTNGTDRPITLLFRPEMLQFSVNGRGGSISCGYPRTVTAPIRELFISVPAKGKTSTTVLVTTACPVDTFDEPGIYRVLPRLDTTNASGRSIGMKTWDDLATAKTPLLLRVRSPRKPTPLARPTLD